MEETPPVRTNEGGALPGPARLTWQPAVRQTSRHAGLPPRRTRHVAVLWRLAWVGSSAGQSSGLIICRSWVRAPPAPPVVIRDILRCLDSFVDRDSLPVLPSWPVRLCSQRATARRFLARPCTGRLAFPVLCKQCCVLCKRSSPPPPPLLRSRLQAEILALVLLGPGQEWSLTGLASRTGASVSSVQREITRAEQAGVVRSRRLGSVRLLQAADSPLTAPLTELLLPLVRAAPGAGRGT